MKKIILFIAVMLFTVFAQAQVGVNTENPAAMLDVNGSLSLRKDLRLANEEGTMGDAGIRNSVLMSRGPGVAPEWVVTDGIFSYGVNQAILLSDDKGIIFNSRSKVMNLDPITENSSMTGWQEFTNLGSDIYVTGRNNQVTYAFQTTVQLTSSNYEPFTIVAIGIFIDNQLKDTRTVQIFGDGYVFNPIVMVGEFNNLVPKADNSPYKLQIAAKLRYYDFPKQRTFPTSSYECSVLVGTSSSRYVDNSSAFMNSSSLGVNVIQQN